MSWYRSYASLEDFQNGKVDGPAQDAPEDQLTAAAGAAIALINSGAIGKEKDFRVALSGHSNPEHEPTTGWANDCITVTVSQK